ncbi:hypothetical protein PRZ48_012572 [Zasmidium cellare]|uniref:Uncharacterized protein n=1 Tax=Zasmidium cellare TaxID=395010 RepID=A0ABR0E586_ZASCE|nr:hypothetical protein PRZ48_012572 [Zasmidium cellare]
MSELTTTPSGISAEHAELISGLEAVFGALIDANYVQNTDVQVPPHGMPKDPIAVAPLRAAGLAPETIEVIGRLPCFTNDILEEQKKLSSHVEGIPITPTSSATSYLLGGPGRYTESRDVGPDTNDKLPPTAFKLATATNSQGYNLAYDLNEKIILEWHPSKWSTCERYPVQTFFDEWARKLRTLEWLPWKNASGWQIEVRIDYDEKELANPDSVIAKAIQAKLEKQRQEWNAAGLEPEPIENLYGGYLISHKAAHNRYWAKYRIYEDCGWPGNFDKERFLQKQDEFNVKAHELGATVRAGEEETELGKELLNFYRSAAGAHAV